MIVNKPPDISDSFGCVIFWHDDDLTNVLAADDCFHSDASKGVVSSMRSWVICLSHLCAVCILCISKTDYKTEACTDGKLCSWVPTYSVYSMRCSRIAFMLMPPWLYADACEYQTSALFFCYSDTITFYYLPLIFHVMINLALIPSPPPQRDDTWMQALRLPHLSLPPTIPFLLSIFQNCNLWSPAVQGAPECVYAELHFITHSRTDANFTPSMLQPPCL